LFLNCHTYYSLKYGTISPEKLLSEAKDKGITELALTDINNTSALMDILRRSEKYNIRIIAGIDFRNGADQQFIALAKNNEGWFEINEFLSICNREEKDIPSRAPVFKNVFIIYPYHKIKPHELKENEYMGIRVSEISKLLFTEWKDHQNKIVILHPVTFKTKKDFNAHRILRAIDKNALLSQLSKTEEAKPDEIMLSVGELENKFENYPLIIENTKHILSTCQFDFNFTEEGHNNQRSYTQSEAEDFDKMREECFNGLPYRYKHEEVNDEILDRINNELKVIKAKGFVSYFLIAWDILNYARSKNYYYVGRGSGANSIASYLMRITDVDPIELDLYFERFINLFRKSPPDFDIDFSWKDREDVTRYIFDTFPHVTLLGAYSTFQRRSVIREIAKVFGLPDHEIKRLQAEQTYSDEIGKLILYYSEHIHDFPSHLTVHAAGIIISEKPIYHYTATFQPPKGFPTTHFDMHIAEDIGLYKFDILGQRGLAKIKDTLEILNKKGIRVDLHDIQRLKKDVPSNNLLKEARAIGCFYVESPAMRMLLRKLQVDDYLGLVAASSVIRPGVAQSGMMREYILRHRDPAEREKAKKTFPTLYELMPETYGVMVYQEDVIKVAHYFAGLTLAEADVLRRGMSGKFRSREEFQEVRMKFFSNCTEKGISREHTTDIWNQIESFAGYAFAKGHSASYAVESYQCLYLKAYYPLEFMVATINNGGGFYSPEVYLHEARQHGATVHLPCINNSTDIATIENEDIYLGFGMIASLEERSIEAILVERYLNGHFIDLRDFIQRVPISLEQLIILIRANVFSFTGKKKKELLWDAHFLLGKTKKTNPSLSLFEEKTKEFTLPKLWSHPLEQAYDEMELFGFTVSDPPFVLAKELPKGDLLASMFPFFKGQNVSLVGYLVHIKNTNTKDGRHMYFGTFIDLQGEWIDAVIFPPVAERFPFTGPGCYFLHGTVVEEFGFYSLEIIWQKKLPNINLDEPISTRLKVPGE
jgi:DNA polymerase-3 subunit alpha